MSKIDVVSDAEIDEVIQGALAEEPPDRVHAHINVGIRTEEGIVPVSHRIYDRDDDGTWTRTSSFERTSSSSTGWSRAYANNWDQTFRGGGN